MRYCPKCNVTVTGNRQRCPLCQSALVTAAGSEEELFPHVPTTYRRYNLFFRVLIFASIAGAVISGAVNLLLPQTGFWALTVIGAVACAWLVLYIAVHKRRNIPQSILYQVLIASILILVWDWLTGWHLWSLDYALPSLYVAAFIALAISAKVLRLRADDYLIYLCVDLLLGFIPALFILFQWVDVLYPSVICVALSVITLAAILVFQGNTLMREVKKRFHL